VARHALAAALSTLGVPDLAVRKLSQGQKRRAALARLLVSQSVPLWLLDEPFAALDARGAAALEDLLAGQLRAGGTVVYTTHQPSALDAAARLIELG